MTIDIAQFHQTFFEESFEGLDTMETALLNLGEGTADVDLVNGIFRAAHSIKGGAATFGFEAVASFTHVLETLLDEMRDGRRDVTQAAVGLLLESVDVLREMLTAVRDGTGVDAQRVADTQQRLEALLGHGGAEQPAAEESGRGGDAGSPGWRIYFRPHSHMLRTGNDPVRMFRFLESLGDLEVQADFSGLPILADMDPEDAYLAWELTLRGEVAEADVREVFEWVEDDCELIIEPLGGEIPEAVPMAAEPEAALAVPDPAPARTVTAEPATPPSPPPQAAMMPPMPTPPAAEPAKAAIGKAKAALRGDASSIRVDIQKVDAIINLVGELVITQSMLGQMGEDLEDWGQSDASNRVEKLREGLAQLERNTRELQESVMRIRMLPISFVFNRFPRMVHDLSQKLNKQVELVLSGEQTELDKTVMEKIGDPLVHLVRNAIDHGIESPEIRRAAGKPEKGRLLLDAYHKGGNIIIEISDDGGGLHKEKILAKARSRGLVGPDETLSDERIYDLIFQPGFSTAETVSDVSGRGVGMDVVRRNIKDLGGNIEVSSTPGAGTTLSIRLPLTLAILDGQLVRVGEETYVIPLVSIIESLQIKKELVNAIAGQAELYKLRDEYIPIIRLYDVFDIQADNTELSGGLMVVVEGDGRKAGLLVDDLLAQQQVVIKSLETNFKRVDGLSGATILGDGTVALILDIADLIVFSRNSGKPAKAPAASHASAA